MDTNLLKNRINATVVGSKQAKASEQEDEPNEDDEESKNEEPAKAGPEDDGEKPEE